MESSNRDPIRKKDRRRQLPSVDLVMRNLSRAHERWGRARVLSAINAKLTALRNRVYIEDAVEVSLKAICDAVEFALDAEDQSTFRQIINLTGTVLHTNLGRAVLPEKAADAVFQVARAPTNIEYNVHTATRGNRDDHIESLICELTGSQAATIVNNNAAAMLLTLNTLAENMEVPVSRGELVEIGDSFRISEIIERSCCRIREIGSTNRTHLSDYEKAINNRTGLIIKIYPSNYKIDGFVANVPEVELSQLARRHNIPFVVDMGSGNLIELQRFGLPAEPTASKTIENGADIITFSGDKLLGGPQCGIIAGRSDLIDRIRKNPLKRALRVDKMTVAALSEVLKLYRYPEKLPQELPTLNYLTREVEEIRSQCVRLSPVVESVLPDSYMVEPTPCSSQIGSGAMPVENIPSFGISIVTPSDSHLRNLSSAFRDLSHPIVGRLKGRTLLLDLRCLDCEALFLELMSELKGLLH